MVKSTKGFSQFLLNETLFADSFLSEVKTAEEANIEVVYYCRPAKTSHKVAYYIFWKN